jgi:sulfonate transport system substrate-binding protein
MGLKTEIPLLWFSRAKPRIVPIDDEVVADEQKTADLYARSELINKRIDAKEFLDRSFNGALARAPQPKQPSN